MKMLKLLNEAAEDDKKSANKKKDSKAPVAKKKSPNQTALDKKLDKDLAMLKNVSGSFEKDKEEDKPKKSEKPAVKKASSGKKSEPKTKDDSKKSANFVTGDDSSKPNAEPKKEPSLDADQLAKHKELVAKLQKLQNNPIPKSQYSGEKDVSNLSPPLKGVSGVSSKDVVKEPEVKREPFKRQDIGQTKPPPLPAKTTAASGGQTLKAASLKDLMAKIEKETPPSLPKKASPTAPKEPEKLGQGDWSSEPQVPGKEVPGMADKVYRDKQGNAVTQKPPSTMDVLKQKTKDLAAMGQKGLAKGAQALKTGAGKAVDKAFQSLAQPKTSNFTTGQATDAGKQGSNALSNLAKQQLGYDPLSSKSDTWQVGQPVSVGALKNAQVVEKEPNGAILKHQVSPTAEPKYYRYNKNTKAVLPIPQYQEG